MPASDAAIMGMPTAKSMTFRAVNRKERLLSLIRCV